MPLQRERVWDYPRPPRVEPVVEPIRIMFAGRTIVETTSAKRDRPGRDGASSKLSDRDVE